MLSQHHLTPLFLSGSRAHHVFASHSLLSCVAFDTSIQIVNGMGLALCSAGRRRDVSTSYYFVCFALIICIHDLFRCLFFLWFSCCAPLFLTRLIEFVISFLDNYEFSILVQTFSNVTPRCLFTLDWNKWTVATVIRLPNYRKFLHNFYLKSACQRAELRPTQNEATETKTLWQKKKANQKYL